MNQPLNFTDPLGLDGCPGAPADVPCFTTPGVCPPLVPGCQPPQGCNLISEGASVPTPTGEQCLVSFPSPPPTCPPNAQGCSSNGEPCNYVMANPCSNGGGGSGATGTPTPLTKQQQCALAKVNLAAIENQGKALNKTMFKETFAGAGLGCVVGFVGTEELIPVVGTSLAVGDCAVGAIGGGLTAVGVFFITNAGDIANGTISEAKAVAQIVQNCF